MEFSSSTDFSLVSFVITPHVGKELPCQQLIAGIEYSESILYTLGFTSNFYFYYSGLEYASENALLKPFLHTWSLSIEEQFYIFFPIIFFLSFKYLNKYIFVMLLILFFSSFLLSYYGSINFAALKGSAILTSFERGNPCQGITIDHASTQRNR